jgi:SAM-dependent methyltransferase
MGHSPDSVDWAEYGPDLIADAETNAPMINRALAWLARRVPQAGLILDVGSGPGVAACRFAQLLPGATVVAADGAAPLLALARERAERLGVGDQVATREVRLPEGIAGLPQGRPDLGQRRCAPSARSGGGDPGVRATCSGLAACSRCARAACRCSSCRRPRTAA